MTDSLPSSDGDARDALAAFGVEPTSMTRIATGRMNEHWRVATGGAMYVLRRYTAERSAAAIKYEHDVIAHLAARAWPVASPIAAERHKPFVELRGRRYALFPLLRGEVGPMRDDDHLRRKGRLLARLHHDLATARSLGQRDGWGLIWELDHASGSEFTSFNEVLGAFERHHSELAAQIRRHRYASLRELSRLRYGDLPHQVIDFDFHNDNLLFDGDKLVGLLDLDSVHRDACVTDIACSVANDCPEPPADIAPDPRSVASFVAGYTEQTPLSERELRLIVPMIGAYRISSFPRAIVSWLHQRDARTLVRIRRNVDERLPALAARAALIESAVLSAARKPQ